MKYREKVRAVMDALDRHGVEDSEILGIDPGGSHPSAHIRSEKWHELGLPVLGHRMGQYIHVDADAGEGVVFTACLEMTRANILKYAVEEEA